MTVQVRVAFVGEGVPDQVSAAAAASGEIVASWASVAAAPQAVPLPAPPEVEAWRRTLQSLERPRTLYLAPGHGPDDDPGVAVLQELASRGILRLTIGPASAPATDGPTVMGPADETWRPAPGMQSLVRGVADNGQLASWRNRLRSAYGTDAVIEFKPWSCSRWQTDVPGNSQTFPMSVRALPTADSRLRDTNTLRDVVAELRGPNGCPWDKQQTHRTLRPYLVEEAYEALSAIDRNDDRAMADEFGDVLLNLVLHAEIARQRGGFAWPDVVAAISAKMIRRHPHVFGDAQTEDMEYLRHSWAQIKAAEHGGERGPLDGLPNSLPSLTFAAAAVRALRRAGQPLDEADRQAATVTALTMGNDPEALGDALLWVAARADARDIDLDMALRDANARLNDCLQDDESPRQAIPGADGQAVRAS